MRDPVETTINSIHSSLSSVAIVFLSLDLLLYTLSLWTFIWVLLGALNAPCKVYNLYDRNVCKDVVLLPIIIKTHSIQER